ncbi:hypothetical protein [Leifsonia sp. C5G2]|uniref:hypothetical protein n=1 Tax=Leifsonia sp. C5G2 TaxID=2735269 RepID=UPI00201C1E4D|nr:hypothetical protein [Leifsonia sp. C5G2]
MVTTVAMARAAADTAAATASGLTAIVLATARVAADTVGVPVRAPVHPGTAMVKAAATVAATARDPADTADATVRARAIGDATVRAAVTAGATIGAQRPDATGREGLSALEARVTVDRRRASASRGRRDRGRALRAATTSCGPVTDAPRAVTATLATRTPGARRSSGCRGNCSRFVRATTILTSRTTCRPATFPARLASNSRR